MTENKAHELFYELFGESCDQAYNNPGKAIGYYEGAWAMAQKIIENIVGNTITMHIEPPNFKNVNIDDLSRFNPLGKEVST